MPRPLWLWGWCFLHTSVTALPWTGPPQTFSTTASATVSTDWSPAPTNGVPRPHELFGRGTYPVSLCGWQGPKFVGAYCGSDSSCAWFTDISVVGCCSIGGECDAVFTDCVDGSGPEPSSSDPRIKSCTRDDLCYRNSFPHSFYQYGCGSTSTGETVVTSWSGINTQLSIVVTFAGGSGGGGAAASSSATANRDNESDPFQGGRGNEPPASLPQDTATAAATSSTTSTTSSSSTASSTSSTTSKSSTALSTAAASSSNGTTSSIPSATSSPTPTQSPAPTPSHGLSSGRKIAIGVVAGVAAIMAGALAIHLFRIRHHDQGESKTSPSASDTSADRHPRSDPPHNMPVEMDQNYPRQTNDIQHVHPPSTGRPDHETPQELENTSITSPVPSYHTYSWPLQRHAVNAHANPSASAEVSPQSFSQQQQQSPTQYGHAATLSASAVSPLSSAPVSPTPTMTVTSPTPTMTTATMAHPLPDIFELPAERPAAAAAPAGLAISLGDGVREADTGRPTTHNGSSLQMAEDNILRLRRERERGKVHELSGEGGLSREGRGGGGGDARNWKT